MTAAEYDFPRPAGEGLGVRVILTRRGTWTLWFFSLTLTLSLREREFDSPRPVGEWLGVRDKKTPSISLILAQIGVKIKPHEA
jgi:hypothetical protein